MRILYSVLGKLSEVSLVKVSKSLYKEQPHFNSLRNTLKSTSLLVVGEPDNCEWGSNWLDRDNPSGTGDWELRSFHRCYCPRGDVPVAIQARILAPGTPLHLAPWTACNQVITISPSYGLVCRNEDQQNTNNVPECKDYEVRYCCPIRRVSSASTCSLVSQSARGRGPT